MDTSIIQPLTFQQLLIVLGILLAVGIGVVALLFARGFTIQRKNTAIVIDPRSGRKTVVNEASVFNIILLLEALKIKDDVHQIDDIVFKEQKKVTRNCIPSLKNIHLNAFKDLLCEQCSVESLNLSDNRDYLYYSLLMDRTYSYIFGKILDDFEQNGLAVREITEYSNQRSELYIRDIYELILSMSIGIKEVSLHQLEKHLESIRVPLRAACINIFSKAVKIARKGKNKKDQLKNSLFEKIGEIDGVSKQQIMNLFQDVNSEDFLKEE